MKSQKIYLCLFFAAIVMLIQSPVYAADTTVELTGEIAYIPIAGGLYGIIGDDGQKYQPTNLPRELRKDGLPVKFNAITRKDSFTTVMWGTVIEIKTIKKISPAISSAERSAIRVLLQRLEAFNTKDIKKLQQIDTVSQSLSPEQFYDWIGKFHTFTLRYVEITRQDASSISGVCIYTRQTNDPAMAAGPNMAYLNFTLDRTKDGWKLTKSSSDSVPYTLPAIKAKALEKYKTDDLSTLWQ